MSATETRPEASAALELRVLSGANAGAGLALDDGEWVVGTGAAADIAFAEPALAAAHLRLGVGPAGVTVTALVQGALMGGATLEVAEAATLAPLTAVRIGGTVFAVGPASAEWAAVPLDPAPPVVGSPPAEAPAASPSAGDAPPSAAPLPAAAAAASPPAPVAGPRPSPPRPRRSRPGMALVGLGVLLVLGAGGTAAWFTWFKPTPAVRAAPEPLRQLRDVVRGLGLADTVNVAANRQGGFVATGQVAQEAQLLTLVTELRRLDLPVEIHVTADDRMLDLAQTILRAFAVDADVRLTAPGSLVIRGYAPDAGMAGAAVARLRADVPGVRSVEDLLVTPDRAREALETRLRGSNLARQLRISIAEGRVAVSGTLGAEATGSWNAMLAEFRRDIGDRVPIDNNVASLTPIAPRGVLLGRTPTLVLEDGRRLRVGLMLEGAGRIISFDERRVRVQTPAGVVDLPYLRPPSWIVEEPNAQ